MHNIYFLSFCLLEYPWWNWSDFEVVQWKYPNTLQEKLRYETFKDLWEQGYYITNGEKFGGDFLVYPGTYMYIYNVTKLQHLLACSLIGTIKRNFVCM